MADDIFLGEIPARKDLWNPTLKAIASQGGAASYKQIRNLVISELGLLRPLPEQFWHNLFWARKDLQKQGLIEFLGNGTWALTDKGNTIEDRPLPIVVRPKDSDVSQEPYAKNSWRRSLRDVLMDLSPKAFERLCQKIMKKSGFEKVKLTGGPHDQGIDGHGIIRLAGLISIPVLFQCKRYKDNVTSTEVRGFRGALQGKSDYGLIFTTGVFTKNARQEAAKEGAPPLDLIDVRMLVDKLKELELGVKEREDGVIEIDMKWFDSL